MTNRKRALPGGSRGQNLTEYLLLMAGVITIVVLAANSKGIFTQSVNKSLNMMFDSVEEMATVEYGYCSAKKCEYQCNPYYVKSGNTCVPAVCRGNPPGNATMCAGDASGLLVNTPRTLVSSCTAGTKCEYTCNGGYLLYNGSCCQDGCPFGSCGTQIVCGQSKWCGFCCGNGAVDVGEQCDGWNMNGMDTCVSFGFNSNWGMPTCTAGCLYDTSGCCSWGLFSGWSHPNGYSDGAGGTCSVSCGTGTQSRTGTCANGATVITTQSKTRNCNTQLCCTPDGSCDAPAPAACNQTTYGKDNCGNACSKTGAAKSCADLGIGYHSDNGCGSAVSCPGWINVPGKVLRCSDTSCRKRNTRWGTWECDNSCFFNLPSACVSACSGVGLASGSDPWGKTCRSTETCGWSACTDGEGGSIIAMQRSGRDSLRTNCYNSGQVRDNDSTDNATACYCK